jgi:phage shock protein PspC (stress-responsive transcriptional regulator)
MNTVIIVNLNGNAFHLEEPGYRALHAYLERASAQLKDNPDKGEIVADLEQAIADKCARFLQPHKNVLSAAEIDSILTEMGPVQSGSGADAAADPAPPPGSASSEPAAPRRLYQIRDGAMLSGVCRGIAAYFNVDVTLVRIAFVVLALLTGGLWIIAYLAMMLVIPFAHTDEEYAAAAGAPFNAQEVIDRAKKHYSEFKNDREWRRHWRQQRREWRRRWREGAYWWGHNLQRNVHHFSMQGGYFAQLFAGLMIPLFALLSIALLCVFIAALVTLSTTGAIFGWSVVASMPLWAALLLLCLLYGMIASPLHHARRAIYMHRGGYHQEWLAVWDGIFSLGLLAVAGWVAYTYVPPVHEFFQHFPDNVQTIWNNVLDSFHHAGAAKPPQSKIPLD